MLAMIKLLGLLALSAQALSPRCVSTVARLRGGGDDDSLFGGDDAAPAGASTSMADMMNSMGGMPPGFNGACLPRLSHRARRPRPPRPSAGDPAEYEAAMEQFLDSPMMQEFLNDPEKMEQSRQALLNNPMAMQMMQQMPGFEEIINDKDKFQERMLASKAQFDAMRKEAGKSSAAEQAAASEFDD